MGRRMEVKFKCIIIILAAIGLLAAVVYASDMHILGDESEAFWYNGTNWFSIGASSALTRDINNVWPTTETGQGTPLVDIGSGILGWGSPLHVNINGDRVGIGIFPMALESKSQTGTEDFSAHSANLVGLWKLNDDDPQTTVDDDSTTNNDGTASVATDQLSFNPGIILNAFQFNGVDETVTISDNAAYDFTGVFSFGFWANPDNVDDQTLFHRLSSVGYWVFLRNESWFCNVSASGGIGLIRSDGGASTDWQFIVITRDSGSILRMYVDAQMQLGISVVAGAISSSDDLFLASIEDSSSYYDGLMDIVFMMDKALTDSEIDALYDTSITSIKPILHIAQGETPSGSVQEVVRTEFHGDDDSGLAGIGLSETFYLENNNVSTQVGAFQWQFPTVTVGADAAVFTMFVQSGAGGLVDIMKTLDGQKMGFKDVSGGQHVYLTPFGTGGADRVLTIDMGSQDRTIDWTGAAAGEFLFIEGASRIESDLTEDADVTHNSLTLVDTLDVGGDVSIVGDITSNITISKISPALTLNNTGDGDGNEPLLSYQQGGSPRASIFWDGDANEFIIRSEGPSSDGALALQTSGGSDRLVISKAGVSAFSGQVDVTGAITSTGDILATGSVASSDPIFANYLRYKVTASSISADKSITFDVADTDRTVTFSGNPTLDDWFDQSVKTTASPTFVKTNSTDEVNAYQIDGITFFATKSSADVDGVNNLFIGSGAGESNTEGDDNTFIGDGAGKENTTGAVNVYVGFEAGRDQTASSGNIFIGKWAGASLTGVPTGEFNVGIGFRACGWNGLSSGHSNFCLGETSGGSLTTGARNFLMGRDAGSLLTTTSDNIFIGNQAGVSATGAAQNTFIGTNAGFNVTNSKSVGIGYKVNEGQTSANSNTSIGYRSGFYNQTGSSNTAIGYEAMFGVSGNSRIAATAVGYQAGYGVTTGGSGVYIGFKAGFRQTTLDDILIIDNQDRSSAANEITDSLIYGVFNSTVASQSLRINAGTVTLNAGVDTDLVLNLTGTTNSGVVTWMEDEDYFKFSDDILLDTGIIYLNETTTPTPVANHAALYTTSDNLLFFQDGAGTEHLLHGDSFSTIWFHGTSTVEVTISAIDTFTLIDSFTVVGNEDDLSNAVGNITTNTIALSSNSGGEYKVTYHGSVTATGGADKEMIFVYGIVLATPKDITNVTDNTVTPIVITSTAHGLDNGDMVEIAGVVGNTAANGSFIVDSKAANTFEIVALDGNATTGNGDYNEGSPTGDITIEYPGQMVVHRMVRGADLGAMSATGIHELANSDVISLYVANVSGTTNLTVAAVSLGLDRIGD